MSKDNKKDCYIIFRVTRQEKDELLKKTGSVKNLSQYIRKLIGLDK
jgi:hypothetical protein